MKILKYESIDTSEKKIDDKLPKRNIANIFDIQKISEELSRYHIDISNSPAQRFNNKLWVMYVQSPYIGKSTNLLSEPAPSVVALFVNYSNNTAFAMPRGGASKQSLMLIASVCNKHINEPFKFDSDIRYELFTTED